MENQKLQVEFKNAPMDTSHVHCTVSQELNRDESLSASGILACNDPEVNQTQQHTGERKAIVYVISVEGQPLMPCNHAKSRHLLKSGKARIFKLFPFTIQLNFEVENVVQKVVMGIDVGYKEIGFSCVSPTKELASGTLKLDNKTSERLTERRMYRRGRRNKLWYREPRFDNRKKPEGWLPPSIQRRYDTHLHLIELYKKLLPISEVHVEVANFDIQKIMDSEISGTGYQQGNLYEYQNVRAYLLAREGGKCQKCNEKFTNTDPCHLHHIIPRGEGGSDKPSNLAALHESCHEKVHKKGEKFNAPKSYKPNTFMSIIRWKFGEDIPGVKITFGNYTFVDRNALNLEKTHFNDAFVIAKGDFQERITPIEITQKRRNNRALQLNRKGFKPSIRRQRYSIQPKDLVWIGGKRYVVSGMQNKGLYVKLEGIKKVYPVKSIEKIYHFGSFVFN